MSYRRIIFNLYKSITYNKFFVLWFSISYIEKKYCGAAKYFLHGENNFRQGSTEKTGPTGERIVMRGPHVPWPSEKTTFPNEKVLFSLGKTCFLY
jgi:hypothetical protein